MKCIDYFHRGTVERPNHVRGKFKGYKHVEAFSAKGPDGGVLYPWMTRRECLRDAKLQQSIAVFHLSPTNTVNP